MREIVLVISDELHNGLRRQSDETLNRIVLERCEGLVVDIYGLRDHVYKSFPLNAEELSNAGVQTEFPFPQYFHLSSIDLLFSSSSIFLVDSSFNIVKLDVGDIVPGGKWQVADLRKGWIATNGECVVCDLSGSGDYQVFRRKVKSIIHHKGRVIMGGFDKFFSETWLNYFYDLTGDSISDLDEDIVYWTVVGMDDLDWFFSNDIPSRDLVEMVLERNDYGFTRVPGSVVRIDEAINGIVVGTNKALMYMESVVEPFPSFSELKVANIGVKDLGSGIVIDLNGMLYLVGNNLERLGFNEFFSNANIILIMYDSSTQRHYISTEEGTYVLFDKKLTKVNECITSVSNGYVLALNSILK